MKAAGASLLPLCLVLLATAALRADAQQIGIGGGFALPNDNIAQITADLASQGWSGAVGNANTGYYLELRGRLGGNLALIGAVSYNIFPEASSQYFDQNNRQISLRTSQVMVPISLGADMRLSEGFMVPYLTLEATYNIYSRSFENDNGEFALPFQEMSESSSRIGAAVGAGVNLDLAVADVSLGARLHMPNLVNKEAEESEVYYVQLGTTVYFGL